MAAEETSARPRRSRLLPVALLGIVAVGAVVIASRDEWEREGPPIAVSGWAPYWQTVEAYDAFDANFDLFADVSIVAYSATDTTVITQYENLSGDAVGRFAQRIGDGDVALLATIFDDSPGGHMARVLADPTTRTAHAQTIADLVLTNGFDGVDLDYEQFAFSDSRDTWDTTAPNWIAFLRELATLLHAQDKLLVVSVPNTDYTVYDHAAMGEIVDRIRLMAYDYSTSDPGPIAPAEWVRRIVDRLKEDVDPAKIDLGVPAYGRDWVLSIAGTCPPDQQPGTRTITPSNAEALAAQHAATVLWDEESEEARFDYTAVVTGVDAAGTPVSCTVERTVRYLDDRAIHRRAWIAHREDLHGVAIWALGNDDPSLWAALRVGRTGAEDWPGSTLPPFTTDSVAASTP